MPSEMIIGIVVFLGFIAVLVGVGAWMAHKRRKSLSEWADQNGLTFSDQYDYGLGARYPNFAPLHEGSNQYAANVIDGNYCERPFCFFDYNYETYSTDKDGKRQTHHHCFSAIIFESDLPLKPLFLRPESFFDKMAQFMGFDDINFESAEFSRRYHVSGPDRKWAYDVLHARAIEHMLAQEATTIQFDRHAVLAFRGGTFDPKQIEDVAETVRGLLDLLPKYVIDQQKLDVTSG
jgi:hypothetical protein